MSQIQAKSKKSISLGAHTLGLFEQFKSLKDKIKNVEFNNELVEVAIFAHDFGKVSPSFQISVGNWNYSPKILFPDVPHSIFSLLWINEDWLKEKKFTNEDIKIILSAIAFHHWRDNFHNIILGNDQELKNAIEIILNNEQLKEDFLENLKNQFLSSEFLDFIGFNDEFAQNVINGGNLFHYIIPPYYGYFLPQRLVLNESFKKKFIFTTGLLIRIDHFTSFIQEEDLQDTVEKDIPKSEVVTDNIKQKLGDKNLWQLKEVKKDKNIILVAPTGDGKTEFAWLWGAESKIFFTLPLRSAVNSIFERAMKIFGKDNVGLLHSDAEVYLYEKFINQEGESFRVLDLAKHLSLPVLVSTGDQVFPSALKYPGYEKIYSTLTYSKLVIDEIQAYDPRAVAIIIKLIEDIVKLGGKFLLMTATLAPFVKSEIEERIGQDNFELIDRYKEIGKIQKHKIELRNKDLEDEDLLEEILEKAKQCKRILVILNTVEKSQNVFKKIKELKERGSDIFNNVYLKLLHSKFTIEDRNKIETEIVGGEGKFKNPKQGNEEEGKILVATQVVEASLDIDADILYTELAPIDSLVQRMGRVLRRIKTEPSKEFIYNEEPNVVIFYNVSDNKNDFCLESGKGKVYENELLVLSLALLYKEAGIELCETTNQQRNKDEESKSKKKKTDKKTDRIKELFENIQKNLDLKKKYVFEISEKRKKELVDKLYNFENLESTKYLNLFYQTLDVLDAGYMSEKKQEALRVFREIYTVPAIPENYKESFKDCLKEFLRYDNKGFNYTTFKKGVLSKYIVNIDIRKYIRGNALDLETASYLVYEIQSEDEDKIRRLKKWLSDVYIFPGEYDCEVGVTFKSETTIDKNII